mmetsp:Transcript_23217/g.50281  ORF Transcript_23217/g.50281 Transcript_23217/m.50281 type:complete len:83 (+) Transcript_23217:1067-1315(+)
MGLLLPKMPLLFWNASDVIPRRDGWLMAEDESRADGDRNACDANNDRDDDAVARHRRVDREAVAIIVWMECMIDGDVHLTAV